MPCCNDTAGSHRWCSIATALSLIIIALAGFFVLQRDSVNSSSRSLVSPKIYPASAERTTTPPRAALCFYGLTRSLRWTIQSSQTRITKVLQERGFQLDSFVHTYSLQEVRHPGMNAELVRRLTCWTRRSCFLFIFMNNLILEAKYRLRM